MSKHTPGPWTQGDMKVTGSNGQIVLFANVSFGFASGVNSPERIANAKLALAAPELLDALQSLVKADEDQALSNDLFDVARAAIAKATGETK